MEPIVKRIHHLSKLVSTSHLEDLAKNSNDGSNSNGNNLQLLGRDSLLDALILLYDECNNEQLKKDQTISAFVDKFRYSIHELRKLRVNLNDFEQKKVIGKGHFGVVQVVREKATGNVYALKTLKKSETLTQQHVAFYEEERDIMAKASSPWITRLQYAFQDDLQLYLVMDYHPGGDLLSLLDRYDGTFSEDMSRFYMAEVAIAIHALHTMGYVHRDIKPDNILIDRCGHIKLADFGSAAKLSSSGIVRSKMPVGTPDYIAPEVLQSMNESIKNNQSSYGIECDFWSLGILMYEMLIGDTPFKSEKMAETYSNIMNHKKTLKFENADIELSGDAQDLIKGLLDESCHRLNHSKLVQHRFFLLSNFNDMASVKPPFVPVVNGVFDTSNFEEIENERRGPNVDAFRTRQDFSGRNLPFLGYTFTRKELESESSDVKTGLFSTTVNESVFGEPSEIEAQLKAKKKENHDLKLRLEALENDSDRPLLKKLKEAESRIDFADRERKRLEEDLASKEKSLLVYKKEMAAERAERTKVETKTLEFLRDIKKKWKVEEAQRLKEIEQKVQDLEEENASINSIHSEALEHIKTTEMNYMKAKAEIVGLKKGLSNKERELSNSIRESRNAETVLKPCPGDCPAALKFSETVGQLEEKMESQSQKLQESVRAQKLELSKFEENIKSLELENNKLEENMSSMKDKLTQAQDSLMASEKKLKNTKDQILSEKEGCVLALEQALKTEKNDINELRKQLQDVTNRHNDTVASYESRESSFSSKEYQLEDRLKQMEKELKETTNEKLTVHNKLKEANAKEEKQDLKINELEKVLSRLDQSLVALEAKKSSSETSEETFNVKIQMLETQLEAAKESHGHDVDKLKELNDKLKKCERELSDAKLDNRVAVRETKSLTDSMSYQKDRNRELNQKLKDEETAHRQAVASTDELKTSISSLEAAIKVKENEILNIKDTQKSTLESVDEKVKKVSEARTETENVNKKLQEARHQMDTLKLGKRGLESKIKSLESDIEEKKSSTNNVRQETVELRKKLLDGEKIIGQLKELCQVQDEQLDELELQKDKLDKKDEEITALQKEIERINGEHRTARVAINEEKSLKLFQEKRVKDLEARLSSTEEETDQQVQRLTDQLSDRDKIMLDLHEQIQALESELSESLGKSRTLEHAIAVVNGKVALIEEEAVGHITHIHSLKDSNFKLTEGLEEAITKGETYKNKIEELERCVGEQKIVFDDEKVRMKATMNQQTKLIDFLQAKTDNQPKKKKTLSEKIFGKENKENPGTFTVPHQYRELEDMLAKQQRKTRSVEDQLAKARAEIVALRANGATLEQNTPMMSRKSSYGSKTPLTHQKTPQNTYKSYDSTMVESPFVRQSSSRQHRMRHNIPHKFQSSLLMKASKCSGCLDSIPFARNASKCMECGVTAHSKCADELPSTCGLPIAYAEHYSSAWNAKSPIKYSQSYGVESNTQLHAWLRIPKQGKAVWENRFVRLEGSDVCIYEVEPPSGMDPVKKIDLSQAGHCTSIVSAVQISELPNFASSDLPYVLKINIRAKTSQGTSDVFYFKTNNFEEKQKWVEALEVLASPNSEDETMDGEINNEQIELKSILKLDGPSPLDVKTVVYLDDKTVLVGATEGLYSFLVQDDGNLKSRARIEGLNDIHQILLVKDVGVALFIAGHDNLVFMTDIRSLTCGAEASAITKPNINPVRVDPLQGCHLLAAGSTKSGETFMCAAATDRVSILMWNSSDEKGGFKVCRQYSPQEPCSCFHFTKASLIVGAERFYEIDLRTFTIEEFLDESDTTLAYAVYGLSQRSSYPMAIIQVSPGGKREEYLLCFHDIGVFVDPNGCRSREHDIKFTSLPVDIVYLHPYLYVFQQNMVEVVEIRQDSFTKISSDADSDSDTNMNAVRMVTQKLNKPAYLGTSHNVSRILCATRGFKKLEILQVKAAFLDDSDLSTDWGSMPSIPAGPYGKDDSDNVSVGSSSSIEVNEKASYNKRIQFGQSSASLAKRSKTGL